MTLPFLKQATSASEISEPGFEDREASNLSEAERALQELAAVFLQQQPLSVSNSAVDFTKTAEYSEK